MFKACYRIYWKLCNHFCGLFQKHLLTFFKNTFWYRVEGKTNIQIFDFCERIFQYVSQWKLELRSVCSNSQECLSKQQTSLYRWHETCDKWQVACSRWHMTCDMWHLNHDTRHFSDNIWQETHDTHFLQTFITMKYLTGGDKWHVTFDMWHVKCDMWHMTCDTWYMTHDMWHRTHEMWHITNFQYIL